MRCCSIRRDVEVLFDQKRILIATNATVRSNYVPSSRSAGWRVVVEARDGAEMAGPSTSNPMPPFSTTDAGMTGVGWRV
jgi:hypothetical protein